MHPCQPHIFGHRNVRLPRMFQPPAARTLRCDRAHRDRSREGMDRRKDTKMTPNAPGWRKHLRAALLMCALATIAWMAAAAPAQAKVAGPNGQIVFDRSNADGEAVMTSNPDGSDEHVLHAGPGCCARWSADGSLLAMAGGTPDGRIGTAILNPDGTGYHVLPIPVPGLNLGCFMWSPDGFRLACQGWDDNDRSRNGLYTVRSADGGDLARLTAQPDGDADNPGDYSPDGSQISFIRDNPGHGRAIFVVNTDGTHLRQITPW